MRTAGAFHVPRAIPRRAAMVCGIPEHGSVREVRTVMTCKNSVALFAASDSDLDVDDLDAEAVTRATCRYRTHKREMQIDADGYHGTGIVVVLLLLLEPLLLLLLLLIAV